jgi:thioredoxin 1
MPTSDLQTLDQFDFHHRITQMRGLVVVIFTAPGCRSCAAWKRLLRLPDSVPAKTRIFEVDVERDQALAREFDLFHLPAVFLFQDGQFHGEIQCEASPAAIHARILSLSQAEPQELP